MTVYTAFSTVKRREKYFFDIAYLKGNCYKSHEEHTFCDSEYAAWVHFRQLLVKYGVNGRSYYLCRWCLSEDKETSDRAIAEDIGGV